MKHLKLMWILLLLMVLALPTGSALASSGSNPLDRIITGDDYVLDDGETEDGNVVVLGGSVEIRDGAVLDGDLIVMGGDVEIGGVVTGNVVVMGGDVEVLEDAHVHGDCVLVGGDVAIDQGALIDGEVVTNPEDGWFPFDRERGPDGERIPPIPDIPDMPDIPDIPPIPTRPQVVYHSQPSFAERAGGAFLTAIAAGVISLLIALFLPRHTDQVRQVVVREPVMSGVVGFLTFLAAVLLTPVLAVISAVLVLVCIGLLGFPIIVLLWLLVAAGAVLGFAAIGQLVGRWISERLGLQGMTVALETGLGAFVLSLTVGLIQAVGCVIGVVGGLFNFVVFSLALGAVVLTRFGRQDYQQGQPILPQWPAKRSTPPEPPASPVAPPAPSVEDPPVQADPADEDLADPGLDSEGPFPDR